MNNELRRRDLGVLGVAVILIVLAIRIGLQEGVPAGMAFALISVPTPISTAFAGKVMRHHKTAVADKRKALEKILKTLAAVLISSTLGLLSIYFKPDQPYYLLVASIGAMSIWGLLVENFVMWRHYRWPQLAENAEPEQDNSVSS